MGKEKSGFLTPKAIANRIKSKGLQKLRWYCQMCQKQCRDENGYKCHTSSETHHRQMKLFMENGGKFVSSFSSEFLKGYLDILRRQFGGKRVHSNVVYQEYIKDKEHIHMNATRWHSLTGLSLWLGKQGICRVDETEKGWYLEYIDKDPVKEKRKEDNARFAKTEDEVNRVFLQKQIDSMLEKTTRVVENKTQPLTRDEDSQLIRLDLNIAPAKKRRMESQEIEPIPSISNDVKQTSSVSIQNVTKSLLTAKNTETKIQNPLTEAAKKAKEKSALQSTSHSSTMVGKKSVLDEIMREEERFKEQQNRKDYWLTTGIEVKLVYQKFPKNLLYHHADVIDLEDKYTAVVKVVNGTTKMKVDQEHVQTVVPPVGDHVLIVNGAYRGEVAIIRKSNADDGFVDIYIDSGLCRGRLVKDVMMEDICKLSKIDS